MLAASIFVMAAPAQASTPTCTTEILWQTQEFNEHVGVYIDTDVPAKGTSDSCNLVEGNDSSAVTALQFMLNDCWGANLTTDGDFGSKTMSALKSAQAQINADLGDNIAVDGSYGPQTRTAALWPAASNGVIVCVSLRG